jgi:hypothetical protein
LICASRGAATLSRNKSGWPVCATHPTSVVEPGVAADWAGTGDSSRLPHAATTAKLPKTATANGARTWNLIAASTLVMCNGNSKHMDGGERGLGPSGLLSCEPDGSSGQLARDHVAVGVEVLCHFEVSVGAVLRRPDDHGHFRWGDPSGSAASVVSPEKSVGVRAAAARKTETLTGPSWQSNCSGGRVMAAGRITLWADETRRITLEHREEWVEVVLHEGRRETRVERCESEHRARNKAQGWLCALEVMEGD